MQAYNNDFDVTNKVKVTSPTLVNAEVRKIFLRLYPRANYQPVNQAFLDFERIYQGTFPGYLPCDTIYHDTQHSLDVTLATARLTDGFERAHPIRSRLGAKMFSLGAIISLFHDAGYIRHKKDTRHRNGAEYTVSHVTRSGRFLKRYLPNIGLADLAGVAARIVHFTGYEVAPEKIRLPNNKLRVVGFLLGAADMLAQMSDRCYLEKCRDRLYPEFVLGGIARKRMEDGREETLFASGDDLVFKTPGFYRSVMRRLNEQLGGVHTYVGYHFNGENLYLGGLERNIRYAEQLTARGEILLRRTPPWNSALDDFPKNFS